MKEEKNKLRQEIKQKESEWNAIVSRLVDLGEKTAEESLLDSVKAEKYKAEKEALEKKIAELSLDKTDLEAKCAQLLKNLDNIKDKADKRIGQLEEKYNKSQETIKSQNETIEELINENNSLEEEIWSLRKFASSDNRPPKNTKYLSIEDFFPLEDGIKLGLTGEELEQLGCKKESIILRFLGKGYTKGGIDIIGKTGNKYNKLRINKECDMPLKWCSIGFDKSLSYQKWKVLFRDIGFSIEIKTAPKTGEYDGRKVLEAEFYAISHDKRLRFDLNFNFGNKCNEGYTTSSRNSLRSITADLLPKKCTSR